ncbi:MAG: sigma factor [Betaproteobacteria bacterium]
MNHTMAARKPNLEELEEHRSHLLRFAMLQLRDRAAAEDMVQETFVAAVGALDSFEGRSSLRTRTTKASKPSSAASGPAASFGSRRTWPSA